MGVLFVLLSVPYWTAFLSLSLSFSLWKFLCSTLIFTFKSTNMDQPWLSLKTRNTQIYIVSIVTSHLSSESFCSLAWKHSNCAWTKHSYLIMLRHATHLLHTSVWVWMWMYTVYTKDIVSMYLDAIKEVFMVLKCFHRNNMNFRISCYSVQRVQWVQETEWKKNSEGGGREGDEHIYPQQQ